MAKVTANYLYVADEGMAFNYNAYTKEKSIEEYRSNFDRELEDWKPFITWYRYKTKQEVIDDGDWEEIMGYEDGSMQLFLECEPNDKGAFKCWVIGG